MDLEGGIFNGTIKVLFLPKNADFLQNNADTRGPWY